MSEETTQGYASWREERRYLQEKWGMSGRQLHITSQYDDIMMKMLKHSCNNQLTHVPSALSMLTYIDTIFREKYILPYRDRIVLGKPFGSQAYYVVWKDLEYIDDIEKLSMGVKHAEIDFVDYSEETMGNSLGVAAGIAMTTKELVWVNITDATMQMGSTLEAIQFIGHNRLKNIIMTVDFNNYQVTGKTSDVLSVSPVIDFIQHNGWDVIEVDGHDKKNICKSMIESDARGLPRAFIYHTVKGHGIDFMEQDPITWHYKPIDEKHARQIFK
jgi:transketolase